MQARGSLLNGLVGRAESIPFNDAWRGLDIPILLRWFLGQSGRGWFNVALFRFGWFFVHAGSVAPA